MQDIRRIDLPSLVMYCTEAWSFQSLIIIATKFAYEQQAALAVCTLISTTLFMFSKGMSEATTTLIGNAIGDHDVLIGTSTAWRYA